MEQYSSLNLKDRRLLVWQNRLVIGMEKFDSFREDPSNPDSAFRKSVELQAMSEEDINAMLELIPVTDESGSVTDDVVNDIAGLTPRVAKDGSTYTTADLELVDINQNGTNFTFDYQGKLVSVNSDSQLILAHRSTPLTIGTKFAFNVTAGIAPFEKVGSRYFANTLPEYPSNGRLNKSLHPEIFQAILDKRTENRAIEKAGIVQIAMDTNKSIGSVRAMFRQANDESAKAKVQELLKSLRGS